MTHASTMHGIGRAGCRTLAPLPPKSVHGIDGYSIILRALDHAPIILRSAHHVPYKPLIKTARRLVDGTGGETTRCRPDGVIASGPSA
jgi:hypothetical protein